MRMPTPTPTLTLMPTPTAPGPRVRGCRRRRCQSPGRNYNDEDDDIYPRFDGRNGAEEVDGIDNDCDDVIDEGFTKDLYFPDADGDEFGDADDDGIEACEDAVPSDYVLDNTDCDDSQGSVYPGAEEIIGDDMDNDCDGQAEERFDFTDVDFEGNLGNPSVLRIDGAGRTHVVMHDSDAGEVLYLQVSAEGVVADETKFSCLPKPSTAPTSTRRSTRRIRSTSRTPRTRTTVTSWSASSTTSSGPRAESGLRCRRLTAPQRSTSGASTWTLRSQLTVVGYHAELRLPQRRPRRHPRRRVAGGHGAHPLTVGTDYLSSMTYMDSGLYTAMDVGEGRQHVAFFDPNASFGTAAQIQYTTFEWDEDVLESGDLLDVLPSYGHFEETVVEANAADISLETRHDDNVACIAYQDTSARDLMFTCRDAEGWAAPTNVYSVGLTGAQPSLRINSAGDYFISFYDEGTQDLMLALKRKEMEWEVIEVDTEGMVGKASSLDFGPDGRLHISYYDQSNQMVNRLTTETETRGSTAPLALGSGRCYVADP